MGNDMLKRVQTLQRYMRAMKDGDIETVATLLEDAEQDQALENMLLEVNIGYQYEGNTSVQQNDIVQAQHLMRTIAHHTTRGDTMQRPLSHTENDSAQTPTIGPTQQPRSTGPVHVGRNTLTHAFPAREAAKQKWYRSRKYWITTLAAAILLFFVLLQSNGALASQFFSIFHQVKPVIVAMPENGDNVSFSDLGSFSDRIGSTNQNDLTKAQVARAINFPLALPGQLPADLKGARPFFSVYSAGFVTFTFSSARAQTYLAKHGYRAVRIPANLDRATFRMGRGNSFSAFYENQKGNGDFLLSEGPLYDEEATGNASVKELLDFLLTLTNSPYLKAQLQNYGFIVEPFPTGSQITSVTVHHVSGFMVSQKRNVEPTLMWVENGIQYSLTGENVNANQLLAIANSLHS